MKKKIVLSTILIIIVVLAIISGYYFVAEVESKEPANIIEDINIETKEYSSRKVFIISPEKEKREKVILYFHGGAYMAEMTDKHWDFLQKLSKDTKSTIIVPDYPLAPKYTYKDVLKMTEAIYKETINSVNAENLILMGDSAGGGLTLGLEEKLSIENTQLPTKTILISPWLDTTMSNPKIDQIQPKDKELNKFKLQIAGIFYSRGINESEKYFVNPINGEMSKLKNITIYTGTYDILNPDCYILKENAQNAKVNIQIKEYKTAPHIWIINNDDEQAKQAYNDLVTETQ